MDLPFVASEEDDGDESLFGFVDSPAFRFSCFLSFDGGSFLKDGGPPMIPPSRNLILIGVGGGRSSLVAASGPPIDNDLVTRRTIEDDAGA